MKTPRTSGVQLHPTSLPGGRLGREAYEFVDWLAEAGQSWWQMLPLGPPDRYGSPYKSASAFASWPGLLERPGASVTASEEEEFRERNAYWIGDWERFAGDGAVADQVRFSREWTALRRYANDRGVRLIGDIPIYVAPRGADHRSHRELFQDGWVAGTPPDAYAGKGQLWGNPLYDWPALRRTGYRWWIERLRHTFEQFDLARIDHFRGFVAYWAVPSRARSALHGHWKRGPGGALFKAAMKELGTELPLLAEDLGVITPPVERLRDSLGLPGMLVLQFGFDPSDPNGPHRLSNHAENRFVYSSTHDSDTVVGWYRSVAPGQRMAINEALDAAELFDADAARSTAPSRSEAAGHDIAWPLIRLTFSSPARVAMLQAQDVLGLGSDARMNIPGKTGAWKWRLRRGALTRDLARRLREATLEAGRLQR